MPEIECPYPCYAPLCPQKSTVADNKQPPHRVDGDGLRPSGNGGGWFTGYPNAVNGIIHVLYTIDERLQRRLQMETLEERYKDDPVLLAFYKTNLVRRGWAGKMDDCEREWLTRNDPGWYAAKVAQGKRLAYVHGYPSKEADG